METSYRPATIYQHLDIVVVQYWQQETIGNNKRTSCISHVGTYLCGLLISSLCIYHIYTILQILAKNMCIIYIYIFKTIYIYTYNPFLQKRKASHESENSPNVKN